MLILGVIVVIVGVVQFWQRKAWVRQAVAIMEGVGLKTWAAKPERFWTRWEVAGSILFWVVGTVLIVLGVLSESLRV